MIRFENEDEVKQAIYNMGVAMKKKPNPVYMMQVEGEFEVETNEGLLGAHSGDYVAYDPISGHIWPVAASYVAQHYDEIVISNE